MDTGPADGANRNRTLAADSHQVLRRACRAGRNRILAVDSPQLRSRRADRNRALVADSLKVAAVAGYIAQRLCQLNLQVQAQ
jgi:hypothetical protein